MTKGQQPEQQQREKEPARSGSIPGPTYENTNADEKGDYERRQGGQLQEERGSADR